MPAAATIRRLVPADIPSLGPVAEEVFDNPLQPARLAQFLAGAERALFVAEADGAIVAQCTAYVMPRPDKPTSLYIDELGTTPALRRRGLAAALIDAALRWGRECGCAGAWIATEPDNEPARTLYRRLAGDPIDAVVYDWSITAPAPTDGGNAP